MNKFKEAFLLLILVSTSIAGHAKLEELRDADLSKSYGAEGIAFTLTDAQILADSSTTVSFDFSSADFFGYLDHIRLFRYRTDSSANDGATINSENGISWGTYSDPFTLDILTDTNRNIDGISVPLTYIKFAFPEGGVTGPVAGQPFSKTPYDCSNPSLDCASLRVRARFDIFQKKVLGAGSSDTLELAGRNAIWAQLDGLNLNGSQVKIWADPVLGLSLALDVFAHIEELRLTKNTNVGGNQYTGAGISADYIRAVPSIGNVRYQYTETAEDINLTHPYAGDDTPDFSNAASLVRVRDADIELHLGVPSYQPVYFTRKFRSLDTSSPIGGVVQPDDGALELGIEVAKLTAVNSVDFYTKPKGNITIGNISIGANSSGGCANPNRVICDFGSSSIEGIQIQYLSFRTQELAPLNNSHCPPGWRCSFLPPGNPQQIPVP